MISTAPADAAVSARTIAANIRRLAMEVIALANAGASEAQCFIALSRACRPPDGEIDLIRDIVNRAIAHRGVDAARMPAAGRGPEIVGRRRGSGARRVGLGRIAGVGVLHCVRVRWIRNGPSFKAGAPSPPGEAA